MAKVRQSEIWWADLPPPARRRPVLILTRSDVLDHVSNVTIAPLTRTIRHVDSEVVLSPDQGLPSVCAVSLDNILTIRKELLDHRIAGLDGEAMQEVFAALRFALAIPR